MPSQLYTNSNAPYTGGFRPGAEVFAIDGDFSYATPVSLPEISCPFKGDSFGDINSIVLLGSDGVYTTVPAGTGYNLQGFSANQSAIVLTQEFIVAQQWHVPMPLNAPYNPIWATGWMGTYVNFNSLFLVQEGPLENAGVGICKFRRTFANLPPTRNVFESFNYQFPAYVIDANTQRNGFSRTVLSRVQYDYFVYDFNNLLNGIALFQSNGGRRLNSSTGLNPTGLILPEMRYFIPTPDSASYPAYVTNSFLENGAPLTNDSTALTNPSATFYFECVQNGDELVAESSSFGPGPWMGNIYERKTRFVTAL